MISNKAHTGLPPTANPSTCKITAEPTSLQDVRKAKNRETLLSRILKRGTMDTPDKLPDELSLNWTKTPPLPQRLLAKENIVLELLNVFNLNKVFESLY